MNTLEYFMAHAPKEPQAWFEPVMETERPKTGVPEDILYWENERYRQGCLQWPLAWAQEMVKRIPDVPSSPPQTKSIHYDQNIHGSAITEEPRFEDLLKFVVDQKNLPSHSPYNRSMFAWLENALLDVKNFLGRP